ncbi:MarR family transcriptional regulator [Streptomyces sp. NPDC051921]|uniref:MarR family winged helix-turn-helix transcriptional regulator n=1 Tax=Streptomyces sp. NPDC051921 TaxID=3155806 RepID=UPI0034358963
MSDAVDAIIGQWAKERPDVVEDLWPVELFGRIQRLARAIDKSAKASAAAHGVEHGEFDVLTTLQRSGPPYALTAGAFLKASMVTSGAITNRIDRMEAKGLVERVRDGEDRRTIKIRLTEHGHEVTRAAFADHLANYARMLADVDRETVERTADGLREVLEAFGDTGIE